MIYIDLIIIVIILYAFIKGVSNGFINEIASFLGLFIGAIISYTFSDDLSKISFVLLFIVTSLCFTIAGKSLTKLIKFISLGTINRILGGVFSSLKFIIIIVSISMVINYLSDLFLIEIIPGDEANNSKIYPVLLKIGDLLLELLDNNSLTI